MLAAETNTRPLDTFVFGLDVLNALDRVARHQQCPTVPCDHLDVRGVQSKALYVAHDHRAAELAEVNRDFVAVPAAEAVAAGFKAIHARQDGSKGVALHARDGACVAAARQAQRGPTVANGSRSGILGRPASTGDRMGGGSDTPYVQGSRRDAEAASGADGTARVRLPAEQMPAAVWTTDMDLCITSVAGTALQAFGMVPERLMGLSLPHSVGKQDPLDPLLAPNFSALRGESVTFEVEWRARTFMGRVEPMRHASGHVVGTLGIALDVTDCRHAERARSLLQAELRHQQKLETIGTLARGVAHEVNNPMQSIMNYAQILQRRGVSAEVSNFAAEILHEAQRVASIVRNLLAFSRQAGEPYTALRVRDAVDATLSLVSSMFQKEGIRLRVEVPDDLRWSRCHPQQIQQVLMNLLANARDALDERFPRGPQGEPSHPDKVILITAQLIQRAGAPWARLTIEDHGVGISIEWRDKLFDPFYTTRTDRPGAGLGLSIAHGIVAEHGGVISVESERGGWTRFHIDLPAS